MAKSSRFSIATLMVVVVVAAADFALLRASGDDVLLVAAFLPLINLLIFGLVRLRNRTARPFWVGFEAAGWPLLLLLIAASFYAPMTVFHPVLWLGEHRWLSDDGPVNLAIALAAVATLYSTPQLLVAFVAGWLSTRYRLVIERRTVGADLSIPAEPSAPGGKSLSLAR